MPIGVYAGLEITGASVKEAVTSSQHQTEAVLALHERFHTQVMLTAMDLSTEAETFGCEVRISDDEIPTVIGRLVEDDVEIDRLSIPSVGDKRTSVHLETASKLVKLANNLPVLGGVIGPFSLAGRLFGVSEALELSLTNPDQMERLLQKVTQFLINYVLAFRAQGVDGVIMAEPAAGLLSPNGLGLFSSAYVKQIIEKTQSENFTVLLHNCGAKIAHLPKILESGAEILHFGAPMDMHQAVKQVDKSVILAGNLDPTAVFHSGTVAEVTSKTLSLLQFTSGYKNFIASSGCDIPPHTPVENLDAFYKVVGEYTDR
ncbi:MAG: methylcobamide--CoM methyltransferase [Anaerolineaceae bacterium]|nr:methylcobamide--CoM methyltransferase [Anaerolineaceae bacterium]NTV36224.1 methylcobamide--CoM methyltransferase [Anaerolineaceae bacterium]